MSEPIAVVVPTFRRTDSLERLLRALAAQDHGALEVVLVDQNAGDDVDRAVDPAVLARVRRLRLREPNVSTARNVGFLSTTAAVVLFVDDDLVPPPDFCSRAAERLRSNPHVNCLVPLVYTASGPAAAKREARARSHGSDAGGLLPLHDTISAALFFRREAFEKTGGFDELLFRYARTAEDKELFIRFRETGGKVWLDPDLEIFHDENVPGGCELRTGEYWRVRERLVKAWTYTRRVHAQRDGGLRPLDLLMLLYSAALNRSELRKGPGNVYRQARLLQSVLRDSRRYIDANGTEFQLALDRGFLREHPTAVELRESTGLAAGVTPAPR